MNVNCDIHHMLFLSVNAPEGYFYIDLTNRGGWRPMLEDEGGRWSFIGGGESVGGRWRNCFGRKGRKDQMTHCNCAPGTRTGFQDGFVTSPQR